MGTRRTRRAHIVHGGAQRPHVRRRRAVYWRQCSRGSPSPDTITTEENRGRSLQRRHRGFLLRFREIDRSAGGAGRLARDVRSRERTAHSTTSAARSRGRASRAWPLSAARSMSLRWVGLARARQRISRFMSLPWEPAVGGGLTAAGRRGLLCASIAASTSASSVDPDEQQAHPMSLADNVAQSSAPVEPP
jgi:hypothetical protein